MKYSIFIRLFCEEVFNFIRNYDKNGNRFSFNTRRYVHRYFPTKSIRGQRDFKNRMAKFNHTISQKIYT